MQQYQQLAAQKLQHKLNRNRLGHAWCGAQMQKINQAMCHHLR